MRIFLGISALAFVFSLLVSACSVKSAPETVTLRWWHLNTDQPGIKAFEKIARDFESGHPGVKVVAMPVDNLEFRQKLQVVLGANDPPELFASWGGGVMAEQAHSGMIRDISAWVGSTSWKSRINPAILDLYSLDGKVYGFPQDFGSVGFWYNSDLLAKAGYASFPTDWDRFLAMVKDLKAKGITPISLGIADHWPAMYYWMYLSLRIAGPGLFADILAGERTFTDPAIIQGGKLLLDLVGLQPFQASALGDDFAAQSRYMGDGKCAMQLMGQWALATQAQNADAKNRLEPVMKFAPFPAVKGGKGSLHDAMGGANGFVVGKNAPDVAVELLAFFVQKENLQHYFDQFPAIPTVPGVTIRNAGLQSVRDYLQTATSFTFYPDQTYPQAVNDAINTLTSQLVVGEVGVEQGAAALEAIWEKARKSINQP